MLGRTLKHVAQWSPLLPENTKRFIQTTQLQHHEVKQRLGPSEFTLSELSSFIDKKYTLDVPVYTVWGACEDVRVLEMFRSGKYKVDKLHIIDEVSSRLLEVGGVKLRLLGLGGAVVMHKLFDNGEGMTTIAGGQGTMWTTLLQMGELVDTANRVYDPTETRVFVTHASPAREGLLNQLSVTLKADFSISAGLHFRYGSSYNEFSVNPTLDHYRGKLAASKASFNDVWETVKSEVEPAVSQNEAQQTVLNNALDIINKMPSIANGGNPFGGPVPGQGAGGTVDESAFKNMWNFNLADASFGYLVLEIDAGRIGTEMRAQGFNFAHRGASGRQNIKNSVPTPSHGGPSGAVLQDDIDAAARTNSRQSRPPVAASAQSNQQFVQTQQVNQQQRSQQPPIQQKQQPPAQPQAQSPQDKSTTNSGRAIAPTVPAPSSTPGPSQAKSATPAPQPTATNAAIPSQPNTEKPAIATPAVETRNGTAGPDRSAAPAAAKPASPAVERKPSTGLFVHNLEDEQAVRNIFLDEDKLKIQRIEKYGKSNHVVHFSNHEDAKAALEHQPPEHKKGSGPPGPGQQRKPNVKWFDERGPRNNYQRDNQGGQGAGPWQGSNRGGANAAQQRGGYQSGASDSEGGRGRGGFGGRGRGRGSERGDRGGRGRGRGGFNNKNAGGADGTSATTPSEPSANTKPSSAAAPSANQS